MQHETSALRDTYGVGCKVFVMVSGAPTPKKLGLHGIGAKQKLLFKALFLLMYNLTSHVTLALFTFISYLSMPPQRFLEDNVLKSLIFS